MSGFRACFIVALIVAASPANSAEDYIIPSGVTVLNEEQLLDQLIGNTLIGGEDWVYYYERPTGNQLEGKLRIWHHRIGNYEGKWTINNSLMCYEYYHAAMSPYDDCVTTSLEGNSLTWYETDGSTLYLRVGRPTLIPGNPKNL